MRTALLMYLACCSPWRRNNRKLHRTIIKYNNIYKLLQFIVIDYSMLTFDTPLAVHLRVSILLLLKGESTC